MRNSSRQAISVNWEGSLFVHHSLGMVNRELLIRLIEDERLTIRHTPFEPDRFAPASASPFSALLPLRNIPDGEVNVHVRHRWPPDFTPVPKGHFVLFQPWEYGSLPKEWVEKIPANVREVWVYTEYLRTCYIASGLPEAMVKVVPLGVDGEVFTPEALPAARLRERIGGRYSFFFNGGMTLRKGVDILVNAFLSEFSSEERVCLVIKGSNAYTKDLSAKVEELSHRTDIPELIYLTQDVPPESLPSLYTACDCYVHPYRAEGYGLPIAEAMACGRPVIVTGAGAARDFTDENSCYPIRCAMERLDTREVGGLETVDNPFWILPDTEDLRRLLRHVFVNREEARERGRVGREKILPCTWERAASIVAERLIAVHDRE